MKNKKVLILTLIILSIGFISLVLIYQNQQDEKLSELIQKNNREPFVQEHSPQFGKNENNVTIVEFLDPQCGSCKQFHSSIKKVFDTYRNESRLVIRYLANHPQSKYAIRILEAARLQNKFDEVLEVIFKYQDQWGGYNSQKPEMLWTFLREVDVDIKQLRKDFNENYIEGMLNIDRNDAQTLNVRGTPTFFVNGKELKTLSYEALLDLVESELYQ